MIFFIDVVKVVILVLFPLLVYKSLEGTFSNKEYIFWIAVYSSLFTLLFQVNNYMLVLSNIYLIICLLKKSKVNFVFTSLFILVFNLQNSLFLLIEFLAYSLLFHFKNNIVNIFVFISIYIYSLILFKYNFDFINYFFMIFVYSVVLLFVISVFLDDKYQKVVDEYNSSLLKFVHEVKNPLTVVLGYFQIMKLNNNKREFKKYLTIMEREVYESINIIEEYLKLGRFNVKLECMDINLLLDEVFKEYKELESVYDMKINFYYDEEEVFIYGDYTKLKQVIINTIKNSIESRKGSKVAIDIDYKIANNNVIIDIDDNGVGIDNLSSFGENYVTSKVNGNGLGVNFSRKILSLHNGEIKYISKGKKGLDVRINIPLAHII